MNIALPSDLELYVENKVKTGEYNCESEVIHEALRLLVERDWVRGKRLEELRSEIEKGRAEIKAGNFIEISSPKESREFAESIIRRGREKLEEQKDKR
jgi:antitoxin ParD1/3/4